MWRVVAGWLLLATAVAFFPAAQGGCTDPTQSCPPTDIQVVGQTLQTRFDLDFSTQDQDLRFSQIPQQEFIYPLISPDLTRISSGQPDNINHVLHDDIWKYCLDDFIDDVASGLVASTLKSLTSNWCARFGSRFTGGVSTEFGIDAKVRVGEARYDVQAPVRVSLNYPQADSFNLGDIIEIQTAWQPGAWQLEPRFNTFEVGLGMTGGVTGQSKLTGCLINCKTATWWEVDGGIDRTAWLPPVLFFDNENYARPDPLGILLGATGFVKAPGEGQLIGHSMNGPELTVRRSDQVMDFAIDIDTWFARLGGLPVSKKRLVRFFAGVAYAAIMENDANIRVYQDYEYRFTSGLEIQLDFSRDMQWEVVTAQGQVRAAGYSSRVIVTPGERVRLLSTEDPATLQVIAQVYPKGARLSMTSRVRNESDMDVALLKMDINSPIKTIFPKICALGTCIGPWKAKTSLRWGPAYSRQSIGRVTTSYDSFDAPEHDVGGFQRLTLQTMNIDPNLPPEQIRPLGDFYFHYGEVIDIDLNDYFQDPDPGQVLQYSVTGLPPFLTLNGNRIQGTVNGQFQGPIRVTADDGHGRSISGDGSMQVAMLLADPITNLEVTEGGASDQLRVRLSIAPSQPVIVTLTALTNPQEIDLGSGGNSPHQLTFTPANWQTPQVVTLTAVDDFVDEDNSEALARVRITSTSTQAGFNGMTPVEFDVSIVDDDLAGLVSDPPTGLMLVEDGDTATFKMKLNSEPTAPVELDIRCRRGTNLFAAPCSRAVVAPSLPVFNASNWNQWQTFTVTSDPNGPDNVANNSFDFYVVMASSTSNDPFYNLQNGSRLPVVNAANAGVISSGTVADNDTVGVQITPLTDMQVDESGASAAISVVLSSQPACVQIARGAPDGREGVVVGGATCEVDVTFVNPDDSELQLDQEQLYTVAPGVEETRSVLTFTDQNWDQPQQVLVTGVDDFLDDGDQPLVIVSEIFAPGEVSGYASLSGANANDDVAVTNLDDDESKLLVNLLDPPSTAEDGSSARFQVRLAAQPFAGETIQVAIASDASDEGVPSSASLSFNDSNWNQPQTVNAVGQDDVLLDGSQPFTLTLTASGNAAYAASAPVRLELENTDNDQPGVSASLDLTRLPENGGQARLSVVLDRQPTADVILNLHLSDPAQASLGERQLLFTPSDWNQAQTVVVNSVNDAVDDGDSNMEVRFASIDPQVPGYGGYQPSPVAFQVIDDDQAGMTINAAAGLSVAEPDGLAYFTLALTSQPTAEVVIPLSSSDPKVGQPLTPQVVFSPATWDQPIEVTVQAVDDAVADGPRTFTVITGAAQSADANYAGRNLADVSVQRVDNDVAGIEITPLRDLATGEDGTEAQVTLRLTSRPTAPVTIPLQLSLPDEAQLSAPQWQIQPDAWNQPHRVTITGLDDNLADGDQGYRLITGAAQSADGSYDGMAVDDVELINIDDETPALVIAPVTGLVTTEQGGQASFEVRLANQPLAPVTLSVISSNAAEGRPQPTQLLFDGSNWNQNQVVQVIGQDDQLGDGDQPYQVLVAVTQANDAIYQRALSQEVAVVNRDDGDPRIRVDLPENAFTDEEGSTVVVTVSLDREPSADVVIAVSVSDATEAMLDRSELRFDASNWQTGIQLLITGVDDIIEDGDIPYELRFQPAVSNDAWFNGISLAAIALVNQDDDRDLDGDGVSDRVEGRDDRDSDGLVDMEDYDPTGYFYDVTDGRLVEGGLVKVNCSQGQVEFIEGRNGFSGYYQFVVRGLLNGDRAECDLELIPPPRYELDDACPSGGVLDVGPGPAPIILGSDEVLNTGYLASAACADNPWHSRLIIEPGDAPVFSNNIPLRQSQIPVPVPVMGLPMLLLLVLGLVGMAAAYRRR